MDKKRLNARYLRNNMTKQERKLWSHLRNRQICNCKFRRQYPIGEYIVDFVCCEKKLVIEADGGQHNEPEHIEYDNRRTSYLESRGYTVIRAWNNEINENIEGIMNVIMRYLEKE